MKIKMYVLHTVHFLIEDDNFKAKDHVNLSVDGLSEYPNTARHKLEEKVGILSDEDLKEIDDFCQRAIAIYGHKRIDISK